MVTKEQANEALYDLKVWFVETNADCIPYDVLDILKQYVNQDTPAPDVKVMYKYMVRRGDGKYMDTSYWNEKGKVYKTRNAMSAALGHYISNAIERHPDRPRYTYNTKLWSTPEYQEAYRNYNHACLEWYERHKKKEVRAEYIPEDWIVIAIPINAKVDRVEMSAREWYKGMKP